MRVQDVSPRGTQKLLRRIVIVAVVGWTAIACGIYFWEVVDNRDSVTATATAIARASFEKDMGLRRWASQHGGVYVPVTADTPPNPYLNVPERDIATPSGRPLTLVNPFYMMRQLYESMRSVPDAPQGHITSLKPLHPGNPPDAWERKALQLFEKGVPEFSEYMEASGTRYFRYMQVMKTEEPCLKCHAPQGYRVGDVRGGVSVTMPVAALERVMHSSNTTHLKIFVIVWVLGMIGICFSQRTTSRWARALAESEERYRQQFRQSRAAMLIIDPESGTIIDANAAAYSFYGYADKTLEGVTVNDICTTPAAELGQCITEVVDGSKKQFTACHRLADGTLRDVEVFSTPVAFQSKTVLNAIVIDITDRLMAEQQLLDKMHFAENLILNSITPTFVINSDHQVLVWNRALEELTGIKAQEVVSSNEQWRAFYRSARPCLADILLNGGFEEAQKSYTTCTRSRLLLDGLHAEGDFTFGNRRCHLVFSSAPIRDRDGNIIAAIETLEDITERLSLEAQLLHAQKMESVGVLAGGVAHDFNNILTVISGYANLLRLNVKNDVQSMSFVQEIVASVERATDITHSLLTFSGKHETLMQYNDLNGILNTIRKSLSRLIREDITLVIQPGEGELPVYVDRVQIEQVLINLVVNARDAMGPNGTITVSTLLVELEAARTEGNTVIPPGHFTCLSVRDSGSGMDAETLECIFEPFFTTKEKGKGTGLGLAIIESIVARHNGCISVTSTPGVGTEFRIYLPLYTGEKTIRRAEPLQKIRHSGTETVLLVEDDMAIMKLFREVLSRYGYVVLSAEDGVEALKIFDAHRDDIRIAIVDVIMPRMNGREVVELIRAQRPEMPIVMTSGYTDDIIDSAGIAALNVVFLQKPVKSLELLATLRNCLEA